MWEVYSALSNMFDLLIKPFQNLHPFWALLVMSVLTGLLLLLVFRYTSNQKGIKETKDRIKAHLLEIRIFKDNLGILLSAQKKIIFHNFIYMKHAVKPMLFMIVPVAVIIIQADGWFGYRPFIRGEAAIVSVMLSNNQSDLYSDITIEVEEGLTIENPPLRIPETGEINWKIRANESGEHTIKISLLGHTYHEVLVVNHNKLDRVSKLIIGSSLWDMLLNPGVKPLDKNSVIRKIEVSYPVRSIEVLGFKMHWLVVFFVLSVIAGFAFKGFMRVEI